MCPQSENSTWWYVLVGGVASAMQIGRRSARLLLKKGHPVSDEATEFRGFEFGREGTLIGEVESCPVENVNRRMLQPQVVHRC